MNEMDRIEDEFYESNYESMSNRAKEWNLFENIVFDHIEDYTVPQYGDSPDDQLTEFSIEDIQSQLKRYSSRVGTNQRGQQESLRDCLKMAHYACVLYTKLNEADSLGFCPVYEPIPEEKTNDEQIKKLWEAIREIKKGRFEKENSTLSAIGKCDRLCHGDRRKR